MSFGFDLWLEGEIAGAERTLSDARHEAQAAAKEKDGELENPVPVTISRMAYQQADAMLAERAK